MKTIKHVLLVVNMHKKDAPRLSSEIRAYLEAREINVELIELRGKSSIPNIGTTDLAISLGGDGTVLFCARMLHDKGIPILAVNLGTFGFITEVSIDEWQEAFEKFCCGETVLSYRLMYRLAVQRGDRTVYSAHGLNEVVVSAVGISNVVNLNLHLNETLLGTFRADGIIIATPTGSTAYSLAAGGPIVDSEMEALIVTPVCPFTLSNRPIVVSGEDVITIEVLSHQRTRLNLTADGQEMFELEEGDHIVVERSRSRAMLALSNKRNFYEVVRSKLHWSGGVHA
ncbi:MAG: NAD(+)/NADH kinase [Spirochaetota bacterium]